jgi:hypothetical protein
MNMLTAFTRTVAPMLIGAAIAPAVVAGTPISVTNSGFESPALSNCAFGPPITGWTIEVNAGVWRPGSGGACLNSYPGGPPEGLQCAFTNSGPISQTLSAVLAANTQYTLQVKVGRRLDCCQQTTYRVQLWAGASMLFEDPGLFTLPPGGWRNVNVMFSTGPSHAALGQPLQIRLVRGPQGQGNFDDVRLESGVADCNNNGVLDHIDIAGGVPDVNGNGVPDVCEKIPCPADIAPSGGNGQVDADDLVQVILSWGPCSACAADINGDGQVNADDLIMVILGWGPCA